MNLKQKDYAINRIVKIQNSLLSRVKKEDFVTEEKYFSPDEEAPNPMNEEEQKAMVQFIGENLEKEGGCDHTFRFSYTWSEKAEINFTQLAMYLHSNDGFCDCEVHKTNA